MTTDTYSYSCRCGTNSPRFSSREARSDWHARHVREGCPARRAKPRPKQLGWDEMDEILAHAKKLKPIAPELNYASTRNTPRDSSLVGSWGRPKGNRHGATWVDANCLRACVATLLQRDIAKVPDPTELFRSHGDGWREEYDQRLKAALGIRLEEIPAGGCPPIGRVRWIACLAAGEVNHAVVARDGLVHDPNSHKLNGLPVPRDRLLFGLRPVPANMRPRGRWGEPLDP
jgi:hypothetical protein